MALAKHLSTQPAAGRDTEAVRLALPATIQKAATHQIRPAFRRVAADGCAKPVDELANRRCGAANDGSEERVDGQLHRQGMDERG